MKKVILSFLLMSFILLIGCSNNSEALKNENEELKNRINQLETELNARDRKINELQHIDLPILYMQNKSSKRFVEKQCDLLALPIDSSLKFRPVSENTVVDVVDTASVNNVTWLYISIPVYDTPMNYKGWIRESDTVLYTKDKMNKVQSDVKVKIGEDTYEIENLEAIEAVKPKKAGILDHGRIMEKKEGYVKIQCSGGREIWVRESAVIYPEPD